jgi:hypothetical protein
MTFYMLRDKKTGKWYRRGSESGSWVDQSNASVWTSPDGPQACKGVITKRNWHRSSVREPEIVAIEVPSYEETQCG